MNNVENRSLKMHTKLLRDVLTRQAGTFDKAVLELVMNAVEAGSPEVKLEFSVIDGAARFTCTDTGRGIQSETEIEQFFETFGTPHAESEGKIWAQFRMGRGQAFSFGKNVWRTNTFEMTVDIDKNGLEYTLRKDLPFVEGCIITVDLYTNPIGSQYNSVESLIDNVKRQIEFMAVPVTFNGKVLTHDPAKLNWTHEDDDAYYNFGVGQGLSVYNLGAYVKSIDAATAGCCGVIVTKKQVKVNFARNDIQHDCPVWKRINNIITQNRIKKTRNSKGKVRRFDRYERISTLRDLRDGVQKYQDVKMLSLIETSSGKPVSLDFISKNRQHWCFAYRNNQQADKLMQLGTALCISKEVYEEMGYDEDERDFFHWITNGNIDNGGLYKKFDELRKGFRQDCIILSHDKLTKLERRIIKVLEGFSCWDGRRVCIGLSDVYNGWTDGSSYIALSREYLSTLYLGSDDGISALMTLMLHELAHDENTDCSHVHGEAFYEYYHELSRGTNSPLRYTCSFHQHMLKAKANEYSQQVIEKNQKAVARRNKKIYGKELVGV